MDVSAAPMWQDSVTAWLILPHRCVCVCVSFIRSSSAEDPLNHRKLQLIEAVDAAVTLKRSKLQSVGNMNVSATTAAAAGESL